MRVEPDSTVPVVDVQSERVDDIPLLLHILVEMGVPEQIDRAYTPHGNHQGLSVGWVMTVWLVYILTQSDHRMNRVQDWVKSRREVLSELIGQGMGETDFTDDRLADGLRYLHEDEVWWQLEGALSQQCIRVYNLEVDTIRLDATVGQVYHDPQAHTLFQVGRTQAGTYDVQFKLRLGALDPMGLPVAVDVVPGQGADDPLYVPIYQRIHQTLGQGGLLYVGDAKMGALETRASIERGGDFYLVPLAMVGETPELLKRLLAELEAGAVSASAIYWPEDLPPDPTQAPEPSLAIAQGFEITLERTAVIKGQRVSWRERVLCVQSFSHAQSERKGLEQRLQRAEAALQALTPPPARGKHQYRQAELLQGAVKHIVERYQVQGLLEVSLERQETQRPIRAYGGRGARMKRAYATSSTSGAAVRP